MRQKGDPHLWRIIIKEKPQRPLTWSEVGLHKGHDGGAGPQVTDADAHEVFAHLRLPEQVIKLKGRNKKRDGERERRKQTGRRDEKLTQ